MDYKDKYLKYKAKYLELKYIKTGGGKKIIFHISGPSGAGKSTLGNRLKDKFNDKIIVKDIDDLRYEFINDFYRKKKWTIIDKSAYQKYIDDFIESQDKPIIFVGLNNMPWWHKNHYYDMHSQYNYYIDLDDETILKQKCIRHINNLKNIENDEHAMDHLLNDNNRFIKIMKEGFDYECNKKMILKMNDKWNKDYKKQGYKIMTREDIFDDVTKILILNV
jgi:adenylate kinase family enzyme